MLSKTQEPEEKTKNLMRWMYLYGFRSRAGFMHDFLTRPLNPEHRNHETQFVSLAPKLNSKWLNAFYMF